MALEQIRSLVNEGVPRGVVLADAVYGDDSAFRVGLETLGLTCQDQDYKFAFASGRYAASTTAQGQDGPFAVTTAQGRTT